MTKAIFFDRDGVLNELVSRDGGQYSPQYYSQFNLYPGLEELFSRIKNSGWLTIIVSNQPDIARGLMDEEQLQLMTNVIISKLMPDDILYCTHDDPDPQGCRKPSPGLFYQAAKKWNIDLKQSYMVGDTWKDAEAAVNAGVNMLVLSKTYNEDIQHHRRMEDINEIIELL
jgi:D-glycero-D-manno-heptose 1,7-bisphosphate phosphatase